MNVPRRAGAGEAGALRIAAIDIGSNSIHMIVVEVQPNGAFTIVDREKDMVRLGADALDGRPLAGSSVQAALATLARFRRLADSYGAERIVATATSAVREAANAGEFLGQIERASGVRPRVISGLEEARLIHQAAVYGVRVGERQAVVVDIGGGSTEITLGTQRGAETVHSLKLGVIRLTERFVRTDPLSAADERRLARHIRKVGGDALRAIRSRGFDLVIGTSGTVLALAAIGAARRSRTGPERLHHRRVGARELHQTRKLLTRLDLGARLALPGLDSRRADTIVAGAVLLDTIVEELGGPDVTLCDFALREALVLDFIRHNAGAISRTERFPDIRRRSVHELAERCGYRPEHAAQVARLALSLFDQTRAWHDLPERAREWLEYAALLHDVGLHVSHQRHHKHSWYLIANGGLRGFEPREVDAIALIARYHRRTPPSRKHAEFAAVPRPIRRAVRAGSALLRIAEALDRSHAQIVEAVELRDEGERAVLRVRTRGDAELERWAAERQLAPLARLMGKEISLAGEDSSHGEHAEQAARPSGEVVRGGGHRRVGKDDAARAAREVARGGGPPGVRHRMELVAAGESRDQDRQEEERADADDLQPSARDGFCGSDDVPHHPAAEGGHDRAGRSVRLHRVRA